MNNRLLIIVFSLFLSVNASIMAQQKVEQWNRFEITLMYTSKGNSFKDVDLKATFKGADTSYVVSGFYDGNNTFKIRFMPQKIGVWNYVTTSNVPDLSNQKGTFECIKASANNHGIVRVSDKIHFKYADGKPYYPFGTTAYAWTHMAKGVQERTLATLKKSGFNKIRMCILPKSYNYVKEEPEIFPFVLKGITKDSKNNDVKVWDFDQFNPEFFQRLEKRIDDLNQLGIEADLIIFHPYDVGRWGFDTMPNEVNLRYTRYVAARLSSFKNVWWSIANEWDFIKSKTIADWDTIARTLVKSDPYRHLCSIHGATATYYDYWNPEYTHVSIQDMGAVQSPGYTAMLTHVYHKPIVCDEVGYEGNLKERRWGRYSGEEMTFLVWNGVIGGGYVTHGECYMPKGETDTIFWAKGGDFKGTSWPRIAFMRKIIEECPRPLCLADISRDNMTATAGEGYYLVYFGKEIKDSWTFNLPTKNNTYKKLKAGVRFKVEIIDTWDMTIQQCPLTFETTSENDYRIYDKDMKKVLLPFKPYIALRITEIK